MASPSPGVTAGEAMRAAELIAQHARRARGLAGLRRPDAELRADLLRSREPGVKIARGIEEAEEAARRAGVLPAWCGSCAPPGPRPQRLGHDGAQDPRVEAEARRRR